MGEENFDENFVRSIAAHGDWRQPSPRRTYHGGDTSEYAAALRQKGPTVNCIRAVHSNRLHRLGFPFFKISYMPPIHLSLNPLCSVFTSPPPLFDVPLALDRKSALVFGGAAFGVLGAQIELSCRRRARFLRKWCPLAGRKLFWGPSWAPAPFSGSPGPKLRSRAGAVHVFCENGAPVQAGASFCLRISPN